MESHQLINQSSGKTEYYTDPLILAAAREVMGYITLDPASSEAANKIVQAESFYDWDSEEDNWTAITDDWSQFTQHGPLKVWMNSPFSAGEKACKQPHSACEKKSCIKRGHHINVAIPGNKDWINKLVGEHLSGVVEEAMCICFNSTSEAWFQPLGHFAQCYLSPRVNYYDMDGNKVKGVTKGSVVTYMGSNVGRFAEVFSKFGAIKVEYAR